MIESRLIIQLNQPDHPGITLAALVGWLQEEERDTFNK